MIDKHYFKANMAVYYGDLLLSLTACVASYVLLLDAEGGTFAALYLICIATLYRAGAFVHEITHRFRDPDYCNSVISLWRAVRGPERTALSSSGAAAE
jgi:hypothetical protein